LKVLVTGGAGFIGSHLVDALVEDHQVVVVDNLSTGKRGNLNPAARFHQIDVRNQILADFLQEEAPEVIYHLAAQVGVATSLSDPGFDAEVNILGGLNLLQSAVKSGTRRIVYSSSAAVYGTPRYLPIDEKHSVAPLSGYGISKITMERYLEVFRLQHGLEYTVLRFANVYGPRQDAAGEGGVVAVFIDSMLKGAAPTIFDNGEQTRDFIYVQDVVSASLKTLHMDDSQILNISTGKSNSVNALFHFLASQINDNIRPVYREARTGDIRDSVLDSRKAVRLLNWRPRYDLKSGLHETLRLWRDEAN
jgi:UDP-glucose 4-epimerase